MGSGRRVSKQGNWEEGKKRKGTSYNRRGDKVTENQEDLNAHVISGLRLDEEMALLNS